MLRDVPPLLLLLLSILFAKKSIKGKSVSIKQFSYNLALLHMKALKALVQLLIQLLKIFQRILKMNLFRGAHCGDYASFWVKNMLM